jgi:hypothetical protein
MDARRTEESRRVAATIEMEDLVGCIIVAIAAILCAVEHFLHLEFALGVPLERGRHPRFHFPEHGDTPRERSCWPQESAWP